MTGSQITEAQVGHMFGSAKLKKKRKSSEVGPKSLTIAATKRVTKQESQVLKVTVLLSTAYFSSRLISSHTITHQRKRHFSLQTFKGCMSVTRTSNKVTTMTNRKKCYLLVWQSLNQ